MTIGFSSNLMSVLEKMTISFRSDNFFFMCASLGRAKSCRITNFEGYFHFCSKWFEIFLFLVEILSFLKEVSSVFEMC